MSNQIIDGNPPYPYSFLGLLFQSLICFLVLVFCQSLIRLQNIHRTSDNAAPSTRTDPPDTNNNPNQKEPVETSENGASTSPSTDNPQSAETIEGSVTKGATVGSTKSNPLSTLQAMSEDRHTLSQPRFLPPATPQAVTAVAEARLMHPKLTASETVSHKKNARPYEGPVFLVDVFRNGVDDPVDTVVITDETLPPRKNRKNKVAWRLPDLESAKGGRLVSETLVFYDCLHCAYMSIWIQLLNHSL